MLSGTLTFFVHVLRFFSIFLLRLLYFYAFLLYPPPCPFVPSITTTTVNLNFFTFSSRKMGDNL